MKLRGKKIICFKILSYNSVSHMSMKNKTIYYYEQLKMFENQIWAEEDATARS